MESLTRQVPVLLPAKWDNYYFLSFIDCFEVCGQKNYSQHRKYTKYPSLEGPDPASHVIKCFFQYNPLRPLLLSFTLIFIIQIFLGTQHC